MQPITLERIFYSEQYRASPVWQIWLNFVSRDSRGKLCIVYFVCIWRTDKSLHQPFQLFFTIVRLLTVTNVVLRSSLYRHWSRCASWSWLQARARECGVRLWHSSRRRQRTSRRVCYASQTWGTSSCSACLSSSARSTQLWFAEKTSSQ